MKLLRLIQVAAVLGPALAFGQVATTAQCNDDFEDCKENCTMEFGTSLTTREKFGACLGKCTRTSNECKERYFDVTSNHLDGDAMTKKRAKDPAAVEPSSRASRPSNSDDGAPNRTKRYDPDADPLREDQAPKATRAPEPEARPTHVEEDPAPSRSSDPEPVHRTATKMSDLPDSKAKPASEPKRASGDKVDPMLAPAEPAPRATAPEKAPEKKKAIDDWAPGDDSQAASAPPPKKKEKEPEVAAPPPEKAKPAAPKRKALDEWDPDS